MLAILAPTRVMLERLLAVGGLVIIALEIFAFDYAPLHVLLLGLGVLMIYVGTWRLTRGFVSERANTVLRAEVNRFLVLVRQLYSGRSKGDSATMHETKSKLRESAEKIIQAASKYTDDV